MFSKKLGEKLDKFHLLKHPFYQIYWNGGKLNRRSLKIMQNSTISMLKLSQDI